MPAGGGHTEHSPNEEKVKVSQERGVRGPKRRATTRAKSTRFADTRPKVNEITYVATSSVSLVLDGVSDAKARQSDTLVLRSGQ